MTTDRNVSETTVKARALTKVLRLKDKLSDAEDARASAIEKADARIKKVMAELTAARKTYADLADEECPV